MEKYLVSINDLPPSGKTFTIDDQEVWLDPIREFKMDCRIAEPLKTSIFVMPADDGCVVRGTLTGQVVVPCSRCAENASLKIDSKYDEYEEIPKAPERGKLEKGQGHIVFDRNAPMLDLAAVAWEELMLSLPVTPLCRDNCKGLCPDCGANLNMGACGCAANDGDPRLAALRNVKIIEQ